MSLYRFNLDGVLIDPQPRGWKGLVDSIDRDKETNGVFHSQDVVLEFYGSAYYLIKDLFDSSINNRRSVEIFENRNGVWIKIFTGYMFLTQAEFFLDTKICKCKILDNSYYSQINNNRQIDFCVDAGRSKNDVAFTVAASYPVEFFDPCTTAYDSFMRHTVTVYEAFKAAISFMTDGTCDFDSSYFGSGGEMEGLVITSGAKLSSNDPAIHGYGTPYLPKFSFLKLYTEVKKKRNIGMRIDNSGSRPLVLIEAADDLFDTEEIDTFTKVSGITAKYDASRTFSQLEIGCNNILIGAGCPGLAYPEEIDWLGCKLEKYSISGQTNIDQVMNLVGDWIVSSNIIQDCVINGNQSYNENIFLIMTEPHGFTPGAGMAIQYNNFGYLTPTPRYYNEPLMNSFCAKSYLKAVPNSIANLLPVSDDTMRATRSASHYLELNNVVQNDTYTPVDYNDDTTPPNHDVNSRFDTGTDRYTAVLGGAYSFQVSNVFEITEYNGLINNILVNYMVVNIRMVVKDSGGTTKLEYDNYSNHRIGYGQFTVTENFTVFMAATDYVIVEFELLIGGIITAASFIRCYMRSGSIECLSAVTGGGIYESYDPDQYPAFLFEFDYPISPSRIDTILSNPHKAIRIDNNEGVSWPIWIDHSKYNRHTGIASFTGIASKELINQ